MAPTSPGPRTAVLSLRSASHRVWLASQFEFEDVIAEVDDVRLVTPAPRSLGGLGAPAHGAGNRVRRALGRPRRLPLTPVDDAVDVDLFFAVFAAPHEIGALPYVRSQLDRSEAKVAYIIELWAPQLPAARDYLRQLRGFDHIFMFSRDVIPAVEEITGVPCTYLPTAVDAERFAPPVPQPERGIDVTSYGRRLQRTHEALRREMAEGRLHYSFDTVQGAFDVTDHREHREALAATLQRSRYAVVYKNNDEPSRVARTGGEESLTNRYFEVLSAGAVMLGSAPDSPDFAACFDWPDAMITISAPAPEIADVIAELDRDTGRTARARSAGIVSSLRRHDWAHRWQDVLAAVGLEPAPGLAERLDRLTARAVAHEESAVAGGGTASHRAPASEVPGTPVRAG